MGTQREVREGTNPDELLEDEGFNAFLGGIIQKKFGLADIERPEDRFDVRSLDAHFLGHCGRRLTFVERLEQRQFGDSIALGRAELA